MALVLDLCLDSCVLSVLIHPHRSPAPAVRPARDDVDLPSKILTAVGKSLTLLAAFRAAMMTLGEGTRSYAKALFKLRWTSYDQPLQLPTGLPPTQWHIPAAQRHPGHHRTPSRICNRHDQPSTPLNGPASDPPASAATSAKTGTQAGRPTRRDSQGCLPGSELLEALLVAMSRRLLTAVDARLGAQVGDGLAGDAGGRREVRGDGWDDAGGAQAGGGAACGREGAGQGP